MFALNGHNLNLQKSIIAEVSNGIVVLFQKKSNSNRKILLKFFENDVWWPVSGQIYKNFSGSEIQTRFLPTVTMAIQSGAGY